MIQADAALIHLDGTRKIVPLPAHFVRLQKKLVDRRVSGAVLLQGLVLLRCQRRQEGLHDAAYQVVMEFE